MTVRTRFSSLRKTTRRRTAGRTALAFVVLAGAVGISINDPAQASYDTDICWDLTIAGNANPYRAYSNNALINTPVACQDDAPDAAVWAARWYNYGNAGLFANPADPALQQYKGQIITSFREWSSPVYDAADATMTRRIFVSKNYASWATTWIDVPWNPAWTPSSNNDSEVVIVNRTTGEEWGIWRLDDGSWELNPNNPFNGCNAWSYNWNFNTAYLDACVGGAGKNLQYNGPGVTPTDSDVRHNSTSDGFAPGGGRGMGAINSLALVPTFEEVKYAVDELKAGRRDNGYIHHVLNMETYNTMYGQAAPTPGGNVATDTVSGCTAAQFLDPTQAGVTCGYAVAPATRLEHTLPPAGSGKSNTPTDRAKTVPEGTHFFLKVTDSDIEHWLKYTKGLTTADPRYWTAYVFARTLREYGWFVSDTSGSTSSISVDSSDSPGKVSDWASLGVNVLAAPPAPGDPATETDGYDLLKGVVFSLSRVGVVAIPDVGRCPIQPALKQPAVSWNEAQAARNKCTNAY